MNIPQTILIIDDNQDDRENCVRLLKKAPDATYYCHEESSGQKGLALIDAQRFDCVLLDYSLPGMNGLEALKQIRTRKPYLPVILLTGQGNESIAVEAIKDGADDYLTKSHMDAARLHHAIKTSIRQAALKRNVAEIKEQMQQKSMALALSEERYDLAVQGLSVGIWDWNIPTNKLYWSKRSSEILGYSEQELGEHFRGWEARLHPDDSERTLGMLFGHLKKNCPYDVEYRLRRKDETYAWIHAKGQAVWDEHGKPVRMVGSIDDVTWRKEAETERDKLISKLMESNSELERFAYICSHDLQEPLRMISSFTQQLQRHLGPSLDDKGAHYMRYIVDGATQARRLINDVLDYARIEHSAELLADVDCDLALKTVLQDLSTRIQETGATVTHEPLPVLSIQPTHMRQLLQNLVGNALKFCTGVPMVHIGAERDGAMWKFSVRDNGIGIAPEHLVKIFTIFQRLHSRDRYPGTGIGLTLCRKVVQKYGGTIWVESIPGKGSTFYFTLPAEAATHSEAA